MHWRKFVPIGVVAVTLAIGILLGTLVSRGVRADRDTAAPSAARLLSAPSAVELSSSFAKIAEQIEPAVVNINTESTVRSSRRRPRVPQDSPLEDFFDRFFQFGPQGPPPDFQQRSLGSGVILDKDGYVITNYHVIMRDGQGRPMDRIRVFLHGDETNLRGYEGRVVGSDRYTDLAVLRINVGRPLPVANLGDSDAIRVGDWVLAIGSPFGLDSTVTAGIISAKGRDIEGGTEGQFKRFLQTDAAINPGNSGGPLVNLAGQVVGINTAIATRRGAYDGVGFAIPSNTVRKVYNSLVSTGRVQRGAIGVSFLNQSNPALLRSFKTDHGIVVNKVENDSPAARAGLKRGDVLLSVDGKALRNGDELVAVVSESPIGGKLRLEVLRDGKKMTTLVEVADRSKILAEEDVPPDVEEEEKPGKGGAALGVALGNLSRQQRQELVEQLHLEEPQGVLVRDVKAGSFAADLGVQPGDIILNINHQTVRSTEEFSRLQGQLKSGSDVLLLIARRSGRTFTTLYLADRLP